ncbi:ABC transporter substrate-binding protein [Rhodopseudomonas sp.]|uniref:ABC transporter substrate-binding protein n=1 Tax=Rhodopseudomonas sp. TaxID=1078 RepID=UPI0025FC66A4|nr:ABC transporter substrate-binding protein [Rhodopseudomonas sp.]
MVVSPLRASGLPRIASINVCTDQLLIRLADPEQILGLSRYASDASQSSIAEQVSRYRALSGGAEDVLVLQPDVVVAGRYDRRATRELLQQNGVHVAEFDVVPTSLAEVRDQIRQMGEITQHPDRASAEIARLDAAIARAHAAMAHKPYRVLPLWRRGWVSGSGSLIGLLFAEAGLANAASEFGVTLGGFVPLEAIVSLKPDLLLVSEAGDFAEDGGRAFLLHPALQRFYPPSKRIVLPERLTVCGGGSLAEAFDLLIAELERIER